MDKILVGKNVAVGSATNPTNVPDGAIAIFNSDTNTLLAPGETITDASQIYFVQGVASTLNPIITAPIPGTGVQVWKGQSYVAPVKQVSYLGYDGSGITTINTVNEGDYILTVTNLSKQWVPFNPKSAGVTADSAATAFEIAIKLANVINATPITSPYVSDPNNWVVKAEVLTNQASSAIGGAETLTVTNGSPNVTSSGSSHGLVAGDAVRIGSATATTSPVYVVESVNGANIVLTGNYAGASASGVAAGELTAFPDASDLAGIKFTALEDEVYFSIGTDGDFEDTPVTYPTPYTPGSGTYAKVLTYERNTRGDWGYLNRVLLPVEQTYYSVVGETYDLYYIQSARTIIDRSMPVRNSDVISTLTIAIPSGATAVRNAFEATLNPWMASTPGNFPSVNL